MSTGPVPKRSEERRRRNKVAGLERADAVVSVAQPEPPESLQGAGLAFYRSLASSGQAKFYTDSDWQVALLCAETIELFRATGRASLLTEVRGMFSQLLVSEGDRRRARLELEFGDDDVDAEVTAIELYRRDLGVV